MKRQFVTEKGNKVVVLSGVDASKPEEGYLTCKCGRSARWYSGRTVDGKFDCVHCLCGVVDLEDDNIKTKLIWGTGHQFTRALVDEVAEDYLKTGIF